MNTFRIGVTFKNAQIEHVNESTNEVTITVPAREITEREQLMLETLFPDFPHEVEKLLAKQAMLAAIK